MRNIMLITEYDGARYDGWSKAKGSKEGTISERIDNVLSEMEGKPVETIPAIKTDAGSHALRQVVTFKTEAKMSCLDIRNYLNRYLPRDIAALEVKEVPERFHPAFNAKAFVFEYRLTMGTCPSVFDRKYNHYCFKKLDTAAMKKAAAVMTGKHDLKAFSDNPRMKKSTVREIKSIEIYEAGNEVQITFTGDDFWPNMVRIMTACLVKAGNGELDIDTLSRAISNGDRSLLPEAIEPKGLFLADVIYE